MATLLSLLARNPAYNGKFLDCVRFWVDGDPATRGQAIPSLLHLFPPAPSMVPFFFWCSNLLTEHGGEAGKKYLRDIETAAKRKNKKDHYYWWRRNHRIIEEINRRSPISINITEDQIYLLDKNASQTGSYLKLQELSRHDEGKWMIEKTFPSPVDSLFLIYLVPDLYSPVITSTKNQVLYISGAVWKYIDRFHPELWCPITVPTHLLPSFRRINSVVGIYGYIFYNTDNGNVGAYNLETGTQFSILLLRVVSRS